MDAKEISWQNYYNSVFGNPMRSHFIIKDDGIYSDTTIEKYKWGDKVVILRTDEDFDKGDVVTIINPKFKIGDRFQPPRPIVGDGDFCFIKDQFDLSRVKTNYVFIKCRTELGEEKFFYIRTPICPVSKYEELKYKLDHPGTRISYQQYLQREEYKNKIKNGSIPKTTLIWNIIKNSFVPCCQKSKEIFLITIPLMLLALLFKNGAMLSIILFANYLVTNAICFIYIQRENGNGSE